MMTSFAENTARLPQRLARTLSPVSRYAVERDHAVCLAEMLDRPTRYRQRCIEQVSFLPEGGQQWVRTLQTQVPKSAKPKGSDWRIVSLGEYKRRRFPDFTITDAQGACLNRLTRRQHGIALTKALLATHFFNLGNNRRHRLLSDENTRRAYERLRDALYGFFTSVEEVSDRKKATTDMASLFMGLLVRIDFPKTHSQHSDFVRRLNAFAYDFASGLDVIQYLCWVQAEPGEILNLRISWTNRDELSSLISRGRLMPALKAIRKGFLTRDKDVRRDVWMRWYCQFGLAPLTYVFPIPRTGSYYFTMEPPAKADVTYLDWEVANSFEDKELDSGFASAHVHDRDATSHQVKDHLVHAYVRCRTREHKQIAAGALLNAVFVFLLARGKLAGGLGTSAQTWLLITPTVLIAYLAEQQRHYYAHTTRRQRAILWMYLVISVGFLVTLSATSTHGATGSQHWTWFATRLAWLFFAISIAVCLWYAPLGYNYQLTTEKWARRRFEKRMRWRPRKWGLFNEADERPTHEIYEQMLRRYCNRVFRAMLSVTPCVLAALIATWHFPPRHERTQREAATELVEYGTLTTTWPSSDCKGSNCNFKLRFVPTKPQ